MDLERTINDLKSLKQKLILENALSSLDCLVFAEAIEDLEKLKEHLMSFYINLRG